MSDEEALICCPADLPVATSIHHDSLHFKHFHFTKGLCKKDVFKVWYREILSRSIHQHRANGTKHSNSVWIV